MERLIIFSFILFFLCGCDKDPIPPLTPSNENVTDIDGNIYHIVKIGTQTWMAENLKTTKYRNGETIPNVTDATNWAALTTGACCDYNNTLSNSVTYGKLYNWYAVTDSRNIAPMGWHVPTDAEWTILTNYLGGESVAGGKLKETGTTHWTINIGATNETWFSALPGGIRNIDGSFGFTIGTIGYWWSATEIDENYILGRDIEFNYSNVFRDEGLIRMHAASVRCVRDF